MQPGEYFVQKIVPCAKPIQGESLTLPSSFPTSSDGPSWRLWLGPMGVQVVPQLLLRLRLTASRNKSSGTHPTSSNVPIFGLPPVQCQA